MSRALRYVLAVVSAIALAGPGLLASGVPSHVRVTEPRIEALIASGVAESPTFRTIVDRLESAPILVFVRCRTRAHQATSAAGLEFLTNTPSYRYVRVFIRCDLPTAVQAPLLAHELQHALEVAEAPDVIDPATLRAHYERIGYRSNADDRTPSFDTAAAIDVQRRVAAELARTSSTTMAKVEAIRHLWQ